MNAHDLDAWRRVPDNVVRLIKVAGPLALELKAVESVGDPGDLAWWDPPTGRIHVQSPYKQAAWRSVLVPGVVVAADAPEGDTWVLIKRGAFLAPLARAQESIGHALGGPNPMTSALTGGLIGAGLGYGTGWAAEQLLPEEQFDRGRLRRNAALIGAGLGAVPGIATGLAQARIPEAGRPSPARSSISIHIPGSRITPMPNMRCSRRRRAISPPTPGPCICRRSRSTPSTGRSGTTSMRRRTSSARRVPGARTSSR
jgi:hypothetical protein